MALAGIGLAVYNGEKHLQQAIESILGQTFKDFALTISDNASTDGTLRICREYATQDNRIRYHRNPVNIGATANFNKVFKMSEGKYFMWAAHDDYRKPTYLEECVKGFAKSDKLVLVGTECDVLDDNDNFLLLDKSMSTVGMDAPHRFMRYKRALHEYGKHRGGIFYGLFLREALEKVMPLKRAMTADQDMMLELSLMGEFYTVPEKLLVRRMGGAAKSFKSLALNYGITDPKRIYGAYLFRELEIDQTLRRAGLGLATEMALATWSLSHTAMAVGARSVELGARRLLKWRSG